MSKPKKKSQDVQLTAGVQKLLDQVVVGLAQYASASASILQLAPTIAAGLARLKVVKAMKNGEGFRRRGAGGFWAQCVEYVTSHDGAREAMDSLSPESVKVILSQLGGLVEACIWHSDVPGVEELLAPEMINSRTLSKVRELIDKHNTETQQNDPVATALAEKKRREAAESAFKRALDREIRKAREAGVNIAILLNAVSAVSAILTESLVSTKDSEEEEATEEVVA